MKARRDALEWEQGSGKGQKELQKNTENNRGMNTEIGVTKPGMMNNEDSRAPEKSRSEGNSNSYWMTKVTWKQETGW